MLGTLLDAWYIDTRRLLFLINAIMDLRARESKKKKKQTQKAELYVHLQGTEHTSSSEVIESWER